MPCVGTSLKQGTAHVQCSSACQLLRMQEQHWGQLSTTVLLVTFTESPPSLGRCDRVHATSSFVTSGMSKVKNEAVIPLVDEQA